MSKYLYTSDLRISNLSNRVAWAAQTELSGEQITDKSELNNVATLRFYFNLYEGTQICIDASQNPLIAIRNYIQKFQFPNTRTQESFNDSLSEKMLFAPYRVIVTLLHEMAQKDLKGESFLTQYEILYFLFCNPLVYQNPTVNYSQLIKQIESSREKNISYKDFVSKHLQWNQHERQSREMINVLVHASKCFKLKSGFLSFSTANLSLSDEKDFIDSVLNHKYMWVPSDPTNFKLSQIEYTNYMDTANIPYNVVELTQQKNVSSLPPLDQPLQQIFYGAPGTGKSHTIKKTTDSVDSKFVVRTTFHPDSDYSTFVGAYKPKMEVMPRYNPQTGEQMGVEKRIVYAYTPQAFLKAYITAWQNPEQPVYLIIEEINRGNCAQIFGDLFQLLDRGDDGQSCYPIKADQDMQMHLMEVFAGYDALPENIRSGEELVLPSNLYIWATMNTSDQSLFPIDSAFKRRWEWKYIPITQGKDRETGKLMQWSIEAEGVNYDWWSFLEVMNKRVGDITSSEDKKLGFFFCKADGQGIISADKFVSKVMFYLWNDVFKDYPDNPIAMYLKEEGGEFTYGDFYTTNAGGDVMVREELVTRLLDALGVKVNFENENEDENENINADNTGNYTKRHLKVIYPDGTVIEHNNSTTTLLEVINYAGPARVAALDLKISGLPMVADYQLEPEGKGYATSQRLVNDGYWVMTKLSTDAKLGKLTEISNRLGLDLQVSIVEL